MTADNKGHQSKLRKDGKSAGISVFGTGQSTAPHDVSPDLITGREIFSPTLPALFNPARVWESLSPI